QSMHNPLRTLLPETFSLYLNNRYEIKPLYSIYSPLHFIPKLNKCSSSASIIILLSFDYAFSFERIKRCRVRTIKRRNKPKQHKSMHNRTCKLIDRKSSHRYQLLNQRRRRRLRSPSLYGVAQHFLRPMLEVLAEYFRNQVHINQLRLIKLPCLV